MKKILPFLLVLALSSSCELFENVDSDLTTEEVVKGLKTALEIGVDSASTSLAKPNGYFKGHETLVRIPLPKEAVAVRNAINDNEFLRSTSELIGLEKSFEDVILAVNRAAEEAAKEAAPIFKSAITSLTIANGWEILNGRVPGIAGQRLKSTYNNDFDSTAATEYLILQTYGSLTSLYAPKINNSLGKKIVGNVSATDAWNSMTSLYNSFISRNDVKMAITTANYLGSNINLPNAINDDLGVFSTEKALNGLFYMVGNEEKKIRKNPFEWALDIIRKVFGSLSQ